MEENRVGSVRPVLGHNTFADGRGGLVDGVLFLRLFDAFMRNLPAIPVLEAEAVDPLRLQRAGEGVLFSLYTEVGVFADDWDVPVDLLWDVAVDWVVSDHMGTQRTPVELLIPEKEGPEQLGARNVLGVAPARVSGSLTEAQWESALEEQSDGL